MPTNAEIHAAIDLLIRQPHSHILTNEIADLLDDMVDNIQAGPGGAPGIDNVLAEGQTLTDDRTVDLVSNDLSFINGGQLSLPSNTRIVNADGFAAEFSVSELTGDKGFTFPNAGGTIAALNTSGIKQVAYSLDGVLLETNEDFIYDIDTATLGVGALNGNTTITSQTFANAAPTNTSDLGLNIKGAAGGSVSGNGGSVNIIGANAQAGNGNGGHVVLTPGNGQGSGINGSIKSTGILEFADNAAAISGGLAVGTHYRTGDFQKIVH